MERLAKLAFEKLECMMGEISEDGYCAGWMSGNSHALWGIVCGDREKSYGQTTVTSEMIEEMRQLARECGGWVSDVDCRWVSFEEWDREHTAEKIRRLEDELKSRRNALTCAHEWRYEACRVRFDYCYKCHTKRFAVDPEANKAASAAQDAESWARWEIERATSVRAADFLRGHGHRLTEPDWEDKYDKCYLWKRPGDDYTRQGFIHAVIEAAEELGWVDTEVDLPASVEWATPTAEEGEGE